MKLLQAYEIKKILLGVMLSDGHIDSRTDKFEFYSKHEEYAKFVYDVVSQISGMDVKFKVKHNRGYTGYRVWTNSHVYWTKMKGYVYHGRKELNEYTVSRIDEFSLAHVWMCDGYLEHAKNRKKDKVQNIGWFCYEAFPKDELELLQKHLEDTWGIKSSLVKKPWGFGYRIRVGGWNLQKLISVVHPHILPCFVYKTHLFYKTKGAADTNLPSAEQYIQEYGCIEDMIRHSQK